MKKVLLSTLILGFAFFAFSCRSAPVAGITDPNMPPWINDHPPEGVLWAIGTAGHAQMQMRLTMSEANARQAIANQIAVQAQGMITAWAREAGGINDTAAAEFSETVFRQLVDITLVGVVP
ncbi:MAG: LPP20 family lipoprotein, partial [Treponema sp.]|nr:LPP20 family lipoprotein [Treponema sp.]